MTRYLVEQHCPLSSAVSSSAAFSGIGFLPYLSLHFFLMKIYSLGNLALLQYLIEIGCPLNEEVIQSAAEGGHLHIVKWAREEALIGTFFS